MKLYLIRHGETIENVGTLLMGRSHGELSEKGKEQAIKTGKVLVKEEINIIYSSPLLRCLDTANLINNSLNVPLEQNLLLIERDFGKFTNSSAKDVDFDSLDKDSPENQDSGVESLEQLKNRVLQFLAFILKENSNKNVLIVTHNNPIRLFLGEFLNKTYQEILHEYKVHNCSINIIEHEDGVGYKIILLDDVSHLH